MNPKAMISALPPQARQRLLNLARLLVTVGLLAVVVLQIRPDELLARVRTLHLGPYALALLLSFTGIVVRAYRWLILLRAVGARVSFRRAVYLYFVGAFFNTFLPTGFGGDVVRVLEIGEGASSQQAAGTVLVDRLTGFIMLFGLALAALPFALNLVPSLLIWLIAALAGGVVFGSVLLFEGRWLRLLTARFPRALSLAGDAWMGKTYGVITACGARAIAGALFWSLVFNVIHITANILAAEALGIHVSPWLFFLFVPVATVALLLPSISGFGVREGIYILLFGQVGVNETQAVALSLSAYSIDFAAGVLGGVIYFIAGLTGLRGKP
jgi:hypothetical protein